MQIISCPHKAKEWQHFLPCKGRILTSGTTGRPAETPKRDDILLLKHLLKVGLGLAELHTLQCHSSFAGVLRFVYDQFENRARQWLESLLQSDCAVPAPSQHQCKKELEQPSVMNITRTNLAHRIERQCSAQILAAQFHMFATHFIPSRLLFLSNPPRRIYDFQLLFLQCS